MKNQKSMVSGRIPSNVKKYFAKNNISISKALMFAYEKYREFDEQYAMKKLREAEENVLHWKQIVLHHEEQCNTKDRLCITIKDTFIDQGRGDASTIVQDKYWLENKVKRLQNQGVAITLDELYEFCIRR